ncbi:putative DNA binding domain-containing protein [Lysinibacillus capsici]|uniref:AlbA family DNA-binding domain-containing protein n=1 Tax=Lysinibacillus TaxID=400634 RepID=UPI00258D53B1|nr:MULTISPECIES: RNA-binding domain-containing protein [Lysinibacillus]WPK04624.1 putative DNA binding domain-containing protein [Lysinibacillus capsici]
MNNEQFKQLLSLSESETLDFKATFYHPNNYADLLKDLISFANSHAKGSKYIICGVKEKETGKELFGIETFIDQSSIEQLIFENIDPLLNVKLHAVIYNEKKFHVLEIIPSNRPYLMKKKYKSGLEKGFIRIRRGATNDFITRVDLDKMYETDLIELKILDGALYATKPSTGCAQLRCKLSNYSNKPITITWGCLEIYENNQPLTSHRLYGTDGNIVGADYQLKVPSKDEIVDHFEFGFSSSQCISLGFDKDGVTDKKLEYRVVFIDANDKEYHATYSNTFILVKGDFLWKVRLNK